MMKLKTKKMLKIMKIKKKMKWLVTEIEAIMQEHPQAVTVEWAKINGMQADFQAAKETHHSSELPSDPWTMADFEFMVRNGIGIVLWHATVRRYFNMKEIDQGREISKWLKPVSFT